ncbi:MAG TPA: serine/threonine-protein kinase [Labilithrix sp.]|nr:serine/threonine-protein kinase [Labilithrix sp.]
MVVTGTKDRTKAVPIVPGLKTKGDTIAGRYRMEKLLGAGSSGFVVAARHVYLRRRVTLKLLASTTTAHERAQRHHLEAAHRAAALRGPHIARIVDTGFTEDGIPFIATEHLEGRTLADELAARKKLPFVEAVRWILQACEGIAEAHAAGIVHGDLKPQNLFLAGDPDASATDQGGESRVLKILDFGMATPLEGDGDGAAAWFVSPAYLAPEQIRDPRSIDGRADVWALGVIMHQLIAGEIPFRADTISGVLVAVTSDEPPTLSADDAPAELAALVRSCLSKDACSRPADVATLANLLAPFAGAEGIALARQVDAALAAPPSPPPPPRLDARGEPAEVDSKSSEAPFLSKAKRPFATQDVETVFQQFRRRAVAAIFTAGIVAFTAWVASPLPASATSTTDETERDFPVVPAEPRAPLPYVPQSFTLSEEVSGEADVESINTNDDGAPQAAPAEAPAAVPVQRVDPRNVARQPLPRKAVAPPRHSPLLVRQAPPAKR